jgi:hypothetical protein
MRKFAILLAVLFAASLTTSAEAAKKKAAAAKPDPAIAAQQNTAKLFQAMFSLGAPKAAEKPAKAAKKGKGKKKA